MDQVNVLNTKATLAYVKQSVPIAIQAYIRVRLVILE